MRFCAVSAPPGCMSCRAIYYVIYCAAGGYVPARAVLSPPLFRAYNFPYKESGRGTRQKGTDMRSSTGVRKHDCLYIPCGYFFRDPGTARGYVTAAGRIFPGGTGREDFFPVRVPDGTDAAEAAFVLRTALGSAGIAEEPEYIQDGPLAGCFRIPLPAGDSRAEQSSAADAFRQTEISGGGNVLPDGIPMPCFGESFLLTEHAALPEISALCFSCAGPAPETGPGRYGRPLKGILSGLLRAGRIPADSRCRTASAAVHGNRVRLYYCTAGDGGPSDVSAAASALSGKKDPLYLLPGASLAAFACCPEYRFVPDGSAHAGTAGV